MAENIRMRATTTSWVLAMVVALIVFGTQATQAQTFDPIFSFNNPGANGIFPTAGLTMDRAGNLYGTTNGAGSNGYGAVYKVTKGTGGGFVTLPLYEFAGGNDGSLPAARVVFGPEGDLYGTTSEGGGSGCNGLGCGTVFKLSPPPTACRSALCPWTETVLYRFTGGADGAVPEYGDLIFDSAGAIYGTTSAGAYDYGTVYKLTNSGGNWTESTLYAFTGGRDGFYPLGGVVFDQAGNLYGTMDTGVFELSPAGSGWTETVLHQFAYQTDGLVSEAGLVFDSQGNLYGNTHTLGPDEGGTIFELTPSGGSWTFQVLYAFQGGTGTVGSPLLLDSAGNLYGARTNTPSGGGEAFQLMNAGGAWNYVPLHEFSGGNQGSTPYGSLVMDANGILYGTSSGGGMHNFGTVYKISP
jgi:uncharacterized repeat protein (TIGR03803 family)